MNEHNPFAAPEVSSPPTEERDDTAYLAERGTRLLASIVDTLITMAYTIPLMFAFGIFEKIMNQQPYPRQDMIVFSIVSYMIFFLLNGYFLVQNGQTLGKKLLGIRIADMQGVNPGLGRIFLRRMLPLGIISFIPYVANIAPLVDVLFIFNKERRCLHDFIADTQVLKV